LIYNYEIFLRNLKNNGKKLRFLTINIELHYNLI